MRFQTSRLRYRAHLSSLSAHSSLRIEGPFTMSAAPDPNAEKTFVHADGKLAEHMCHVVLIELTLMRASELRRIHREHRPDDCGVHLQAAVYMVERGES